MPQIGYYATTAVRPKYATTTFNRTGSPSAGSLNDEFTGSWNCTLVPTMCKALQMQSTQYNKINVGVWKDASTGVIKESNTTIYKGDGITNSGERQGNNGNKNTGYGATLWGWAMGNGTSNAVLSYSIKIDSTTDHIETAQMR